MVGLGLALLALAGVAHLARRAAIATSSRRDRSLIHGAWFGGLALAIQCTSDFPLHIPGVVVAAVVLAAFLRGLGLDAWLRQEFLAPTPPEPSGAMPVLERGRVDQRTS